MSPIVSGSAVLGLIVSGYALYVEYEIEQAHKANTVYSAACDLGESMSCSDVLSSEYGHILSKWGIVPSGHALDLPNALYGGLFYVLALFYPLYKDVAGGLGRTAFLFASTLSLAFSLYLAYILRFVLHDFCLVCVSSYIINIIIFYGAATAYLRGSKTGKKAASSSASKLE